METKAKIDSDKLERENGNKTVIDLEAWKDLTRELITSKAMGWQMQGFIESCISDLSEVKVKR